jgi:hypothetical protein
MCEASPHPRRSASGGADGGAGGGPSFPAELEFSRVLRRAVRLAATDHDTIADHHRTGVSTLIGIGIGICRLPGIAARPAVARTRQSLLRPVLSPQFVG